MDSHQLMRFKYSCTEYNAWIVKTFIASSDCNSALQCQPKNYMDLHFTLTLLFFLILNLTTFKESSEQIQTSAEEREINTYTTN